MFTSLRHSLIIYWSTRMSWAYVVDYVILLDSVDWTNTGVVDEAGAD